jgi:hypothetical protein
VTEQDSPIAVADVERAVAPQVPAPEQKTTSSDARKATKKPKPRTNTATEEEKRLARNAALRDWRKKNKDRVKAYMTEWRAKRSGKKPDETPQPIATTRKPAAPEATSKKAKPSKATKKSKAKKGGKA